jgi:hypothetical protein
MFRSKKRARNPRNSIAVSGPKKAKAFLGKKEKAGRKSVPPAGAWVQIPTSARNPFSFYKKEGD